MLFVRKCPLPVHADYDPWYLLHSIGLEADLLAHRMGKGTARMMPARKDFVRICRSDLTLDAMNSKHVEKSKQIRTTNDILMSKVVVT